MIALAVLLLAAAGPSPDPPALPASVRAFLERRESCAHWAGEEPYDRDRAREIAHALATDRCDRVDRDAQALRRRYARQPGILKRIEEASDGE